MMKEGKRIIFDGKKRIEARNINAYLFDAPNFFVEPRSKPLCAVPTMNKGSQPTDGGNLIIGADELDEFLRREPRAEKFIRPLIGADEFINGKTRWCLWLVDATEDEIRSMPLVFERVEAVREFRLSSKKAATRAWAAKPHLFTEIRQPTTNFVAVPEISSGLRRYVPMNFLSPDLIVTNKIQCVPNAELFHFAVLTSSVHMSWMRTVCGRFKSDYDYSSKIVYNNFPWLKPTLEQYLRLTGAANLILDVRAEHEGCSLAELYNESTMPDDLRAAHEENDRLVLAMYGFDRETEETEIVSRLMIMHEELEEIKRDATD